MSKDRNTDAQLDYLTKDLTREFGQWDHLMEFGGSDPFHTDGVNLNLTRNHIISDKLQIEEIIAKEQDEPTLFGSSYPEIYHRETPPEMPYDFMVKVEEIRERAKTQLALYEQDPNFCYMRDHGREVFEKGETKATKAAGLSKWSYLGLSGYRKIVEQDDLVSMRRSFYRPYEELAPEWAELAQKLRNFLEADHSMDDNTPVSSYDEEYEEDSDAGSDIAESGDMEVEPQLKPAPVKSSLNDIIQNAKARAEGSAPAGKPREEQMTLF